MRGERGEVSLTALLMASVLMIIVLGASLTTLERFTSVAADGNRRTASQDAARSAVDRISAALRNLASPTPQQPEAVDLAGPTDVVFKTVDPLGPNAGTNATNTKRVRYCLDTQGALREQTQTWTTGAVPAVPSTTGCPAASGWTSTQTIATGVANGAVPIFTYDAAATAAITGIHLELLIDTDPLQEPGATRLATGVFLRNQNRPPTAAFTATPSAGRILLNGSASADPEGQALSYTWLDGTTTIGTGIVFNYTVAVGSSHTLRVQVADPAGLTTTSAPQTVIG
ncbi:MAG: hypothetical protein H0V81_17215 [Solirubrobacterales bacterium]|nr:hypothetical protein [Solirubrobacterales bacterium]